MITVTEKAKQKLKELRMTEQKGDDCFVRVAVETGGCSGLSYKLDFDDKEQKDDQVFEEGDFKIVLDMRSFLYLAGTTLDYSDGLNGKGFEFNNPNATRTCGCGESFSV